MDCRGGPYELRREIGSSKECPSDGWVAFSEDESRVVAYAATYDEVVSKAEK